jgi:hypothetical protein
LLNEHYLQQMGIPQMTWIYGRTVRAIALIAGLSRIAAFAAPVEPSPNITYTAAGTFGSPISGSDTFKLAGEPFTISVVANDSALSGYHGPTYAGYYPLQLTGTIYSGLDPAPVAISSRQTWIVLSNGEPSYDQFVLGCKLKILTLRFTISANIMLPKGTLETVHNHPFGPITLSPDTATMTYVNGTDSTTLGMIGTLTAVAGGGEATTASAHGIQTERSTDTVPLDSVRRRIWPRAAVLRIA